MAEFTRKIEEKYFVGNYHEKTLNQLKDDLYKKIEGVMMETKNAVSINEFEKLKARCESLLDKEDQFGGIQNRRSATMMEGNDSWNNDSSDRTHQ